MGDLIVNLTAVIIALFLPGWEIDLTFSELDRGVIATAYAEPEYLLGGIIIDTLQMDRSDTLQAMGVVAHEIAHIAMWELSELAEETNKEYALALQEILATRIERFFIRTARHVSVMADSACERRIRGPGPP